MQSKSHGLRVARDLLRIAGETKRWWLLPLVVVSLLFVVLVAASATAASPFVYTLF